MTAKKTPAEATPVEKTEAKDAPATATKGSKGIGKPVVIDEDSPSRGGIDIVMSRTQPGDPTKSR